ncbi:hypothetical protein [Lysinibacillus telephonicus]|uniref:Uncharacterized protein n=1 Tax=Lysinibacillus telephonicus TaxID=1714840 RepID=A0A3S0QNY0_9BACI|nr:hypothetical protein [Lysinibacillus telephonicus]RTQ87629.1 hypothetical protein EKG35_18795 [Lysinibacillus telephonicus]
MFRFIRLLRMRDLEIIEVVHNSVKICLLIIEDKRRALNDSEKQLTPYNLMDENELKDEIHNVLYLYILTGEELTKQQNDSIIEFADDLLHEVIPTAKIVKRIIDKNMFSNLPVTLQLCIA